MARFELLEYPDPRLRIPAEPVTCFDDDLVELVDHLIGVVRESNILGLSAPQLNDRRAVAVVAAAGGGAPDVYVNPRVEQRAALGLVQESCLSVPGVEGNVFRHTRLHVSAQAVDGTSFERELQGMSAVCLLHEIDHLEGKLFIDRLSWFRRWRLRSKLRAAA